MGWLWACSIIIQCYFDSLHLSQYDLLLGRCLNPNTFWVFGVLVWTSTFALLNISRLVLFVNFNISSCIPLTYASPPVSFCLQSTFYRQDMWRDFVGVFFGEIFLIEVCIFCLCFRLPNLRFPVLKFPNQGNITNKKIDETWEFRPPQGLLKMVLMLRWSYL